MKQKYTILKGEDNKSIRIQEFAELDKDVLSLLCEETYDIKNIKSAVSEGRDAVVSTIRTMNMYPAGVYAEKIADSVIMLCNSKDQDSVEVDFDDFDLISTKQKRIEEPVVVAAEESAEIDELIDDEDNYDEDFDEKSTPIIKNDASIKVDEDDSVDLDDDV